MPHIEPIFDIPLINARRERVARAANAPDFLLRRVSENLCDRISLVQRTFSDVVVLGAHNGVMNDGLAKLNNVQRIVSVDPSEAMLARCTGRKVHAEQEWLPFKDGSLHLIVSPLMLHYANDLPGTLVQIRRALKNDGLLLAALLGGETLSELRQAWVMAEAELTDGAAPRVAPFADIRDLGALLQRAGFALPVVDSERVTVTYASPLTLMRDLKAMAASNPLVARSRRPVTKGVLRRACDIYVEQFADPATGRIPATVEIMTLSAWAPDDSQPKPLRPGSAKVSLADILGGTEHKPISR